jgi:benzoyl-CoA reductase/2-hydroxyglutaryl-CoA dehydratase subunit BcrC/BadD/HgdB
MNLTAHEHQELLTLTNNNGVSGILDFLTVYCQTQAEGYREGEEASEDMSKAYTKLEVKLRALSDLAYKLSV